MRNLDKDPGAVPRLGIAAACASVGQIQQDLETLLNDVVRFMAVDVGDESDTAGVVLVGGVVEALWCG
jgi:hypothetical protein